MDKKNEINENKESLMGRSPLSEEEIRDQNIRPVVLEEFQGQKEIKENLTIFIDAARKRDEALDHLFISGPPGLGKTTLAGIMANELHADFKVTSAPALEKPKDLAGLLTTITEKTVFFIDEIHRLKPAIEEMLYIAMEDYELDWVIGQGPSARTVRIPVPPFTLVGATTRPGKVTGPLHTRFGITVRISFYEQAELCQIIKRSAGILHIAIEDKAALRLAESSRGTPRIANRLLRRMRDFAQHNGKTIIDTKIVNEGLKRLKIDKAGLEPIDRQILTAIIKNYNGGPVGAENLAISIGESIDTLEEFYEPYLIQKGLLQRTPRGRVATSRAYKHLGLELSDQNENQELLF